jgi:hypothetical protein
VNEEIEDIDGLDFEGLIIVSALRRGAGTRDSRDD